MYIQLAQHKCLISNFGFVPKIVILRVHQASRHFCPCCAVWKWPNIADSPWAACKQNLAVAQHSQQACSLQAGASVLCTYTLGTTRENQLYTSFVSAACLQNTMESLLSLLVEHASKVTTFCQSQTNFSLLVNYDQGTPMSWSVAAGPTWHRWSV